MRRTAHDRPSASEASGLTGEEAMWARQGHITNRKDGVHMAATSDGGRRKMHKTSGDRGMLVQEREKKRKGKGEPCPCCFGRMGGERANAGSQHWTQAVWSGWARGVTAAVTAKATESSLATRGQASHQRRRRPGRLTPTSFRSATADVRKTQQAARKLDGNGEALARAREREARREGGGVWHGVRSGMLYRGMCGARARGAWADGEDGPSEENGPKGRKEEN
uniref:Uncharacterized protein n=1 Tax=Oryza australiensis TaxID=4532 RepID=A0A1V1H161_9ORYZ|nr:hypothetical protein [Oryza australiensis]